MLRNRRLSMRDPGQTHAGLASPRTEFLGKRNGHRGYGSGREENRNTISGRLLNELVEGDRLKNGLVEKLQHEAVVSQLGRNIGVSVVARMSLITLTPLSRYSRVSYDVTNHLPSMPYVVRLTLPTNAAKTHLIST